MSKAKQAKAITAKATKATTDLATTAQLATELKRATALAKQYGGAAELLTLAESQANHPELVLTTEDMLNTAYFHLRFRPCSICGRFPARATAHYAKHADGSLDAKGHVTDPGQKAAIATRVAKMLETLAAEADPKAKPAKKGAKVAA